MMSSQGVRDLRRQLVALDPGKTLLTLLDKLEDHALFAERIERIHKMKLPLRDARAILLNMPLAAGEHEAVRVYCEQAVKNIDQAVDYLALQIQRLVMERNTYARNGYNPVPELQQSSEDQDQPVHCDVQPL